MSLRPLLLTWLALMVLLAATVTASFLPIGNWRQVANLMIAGTKAALILAIFMNLRREATMVRLVAITAGVLLSVLAAMLTADYHLRATPFAAPVIARALH